MEATKAAPAHTWPEVCVVNDRSSGLSDADAEKMVAAVAHQVLFDFGPAWGAGAHFHFAGQGHKPPAGMWCVALLDSSDTAGALGYHDLTPDGLPLGKVFAGTDRQYGASVSVTLSHEVLEMLADPWISLAAQADDGRFYAWETGDPVEADALGYQIDGVQVSDFVLPAWFGHGSGPVDHRRHVSAPLQLAPGGYVSVFDPSSGQGWQQIASRSAPADPSASAGAADRFHAIPRVGSRRERRFRGRSNWVPSTYEQE